MDDLYIVMPTYNEAENIESVFWQWYPKLEGKGENSRLIIADGGSEDHTLSILSKLQKQCPKLMVFSKPGTDHGTKLIFLYDHAIKQNADYVFQTDSDGQTNPEEFDAFWNERQNFDAILGNRSDRQDGWQRILVEKVLRFVLWLFFKVKLPDANAPFRLVKTALLKKHIYKLPADFNLPNALLCVYFAHYGENVSYRHVSFKPRQGGKNYMNMKRILKIGWKALGDFKKLQAGMKNDIC